MSKGAPIHRSLSRLKATQVLTIEPSSFTQQISIRMEKGADNDSKAYYLQSVYHDRSSLINQFSILGRQIITGKALWRPSLLFCGEFTNISLYRE